MRKKYWARKFIFQVGLGSFLIMAGGCVTPGTTAKVTSGESGPTIQEAQMEAYNGPMARIAVARFKDKTGAGQQWWNPKIGDGMADQLTTALFSTNRFIVLERETLGDVLTEQDLATAGRVSKETAAPTGQVEGAELLVVGAVTEFEGAASGAGGGLGGYAGAGAAGMVLGAIAGGYSKAHMAIDLRVIDARTSRVLAATSVEGEATDVNLGGMLGGAVGGGGLGAALGGWKNTPIEKALRICIIEAVKFVVSKTPQQFYHYASEGNAAPKTVQESPSSAAQPPTSEGASPALLEKEKAKGTASAAGPGKSVVREMQEILNSLGHDIGAADGVSGKKTKTAVSKFQKDQGLDVNGQLDTKTIQKLREIKNQGQKDSEKNVSEKKVEPEIPLQGKDVEKIDKATTQEPPATAASAQQIADSGKKVMIITKGKTEIMKEPSPLSEVLRTVESGVSLEKTGGQGNWVKVKTSHGEEGYVFQDNVK